MRFTVESASTSTVRNMSLVSCSPAATSRTHEALGDLTDREEQVLRMLAVGLSNAEIAQVVYGCKSAVVVEECDRLRDLEAKGFGVEGARGVEVGDRESAESGDDSDVVLGLGHEGDSFSRN